MFTQNSNVFVNGKKKNLILLHFLQCKLHPKGGLVASTFTNCLEWCKLYREKFVAYFNKDVADVGILFGVIDVYKKISPQMKTNLESFTDTEQNIYVFCCWF